MSNTPHLTLYVDIISAYGYLVFQRLLQSPSLLPYTTVLPTHLTKVFAKTKNPPPTQVPEKRAYIVRDAHRQAGYHNIPLHPSAPCAPFPFSTVAALHALCLIQEEEPARLVGAMKDLYEAYWVHGRRVEDPEVVADVLKLGGEQMARAADVGKTALERNTEKMVASGGFGMPWLVVTNRKGEEDVFWGFDHFEQAVEFMGIDEAESRL